MTTLWEEMGIPWPVYSRLSLEQKIKMIRRYRGIGPVRGLIRDVQNRWSWWKENRKIKREGYQRLLHAWYRERAERYKEDQK